MFTLFIFAQRPSFQAVQNKDSNVLNVRKFVS